MDVLKKGMLTAIKLSPRFYQPSLGFSATERRILKEHYQILTDGILQGYRDNPTPSSVARSIVVKKMIAEQGPQILAQINSEPSQLKRGPIPQEFEEEVIAARAEFLFKIGNMYYFGREAEGIEGDFSLAFNIASFNTSQSRLQVSVKGDNFEKQTSIPIEDGSPFKNAFHAYWDFIKRSGFINAERGPIAYENFDHLRQIKHNTEIRNWGLIDCAIGDMGFIIGAQFQMKLFALMASTFPDTANPFPEMTLKAYKTAAEHAGIVSKI